MSAPEETTAKRVSILDLPEEVVFDHLLPILPIRDLTALSAVNKVFHRLANDETLWSQLTLSTFHLSKHTLAPAHPTSGWSKRLFQGLSAPRMFVWGDANNSRLGLPQPPPNAPRIMIHLRWVHTPREITGQFHKSDTEMGRTWKEHLQDSLAVATGTKAVEGAGERRKGIVEVQAGGWSFAARDMEGAVWVWGQLDGTGIRFRPDSWEDSQTQVPEPTRIPLPCIAESISLGRKHLLVLDSDNLIWELRAYGRAYHHTAPMLTSPANPGSKANPHHIIQVSSGWDHSAALTSSGKVHYWYPFTPLYDEHATPQDQLNGPTGSGGNENRRLRWGKVGDVVHTLEDLPLRPEDISNDIEIIGEGAKRTVQQLQSEWDGHALSHRDKKVEEKVVRIASGQDFVVALKANGEVWYHPVSQGASEGWEYLPFFSGPNVSHITAQFLSITSYSTLTGAVYHTRLPERRPTGFGLTLLPDALPTLQGKGVIQVAIGDYHAAALTSQGEMYTWGKGDHGQLGLGISGVQVSERGQAGVREPRRVVFPDEEPPALAELAIEEKKKHFVFGITAAGWHTGALVLGDPTDKTPLPPMKSALTPDRDQEIARPMPMPMPGGFPHGGNGNEPDGVAVGVPGETGLGGVAPAGGPMFRIGFPGRGARIGGVAQRNWVRRSTPGGATTTGDATQTPQEGADGSESDTNRAGGTGRGGDDDDNNNGDLSDLSVRGTGRVIHGLDSDSRNDVWRQGNGH